VFLQAAIQPSQADDIDTTTRRIRYAAVQAAVPGLRWDGNPTPGSKSRVGNRLACELSGLTPYLRTVA
jgi:hypothetical protein